METFDLAVAKKAYSLVWQSPEEFSDVIARMGSFHLTCAVMGALGRKRDVVVYKKSSSNQRPVQVDR